MATGGETVGDIGGTTSRLHQQLDTALDRAVGLHRTGASEEAVLAETAVAVGAAKALELLTGESWEAHLERKEERAAGPGDGAPLPGGPSPDAEPRRWLRRGGSNKNKASIR